MEILPLDSRLEDIFWNHVYQDVPHHHFDEPGIRDLFKKWELMSLAEQVITYLERGEDFVGIFRFAAAF